VTAPVRPGTQQPDESPLDALARAHGVNLTADEADSSDVSPLDALAAKHGVDLSAPPAPARRVAPPDFAPRDETVVRGDGRHSDTALPIRALEVAGEGAMQAIRHPIETAKGLIVQPAQSLYDAVLAPSAAEMERARRGDVSPAAEGFAGKMGVALRTPDAAQRHQMLDAPGVTPRQRALGIAQTAANVAAGPVGGKVAALAEGAGASTVLAHSLGAAAGAMPIGAAYSPDDPLAGAAGFALLGAAVPPLFEGAKRGGAEIATRTAAARQAMAARARGAVQGVRSKLATIATAPQEVERLKSELAQEQERRSVAERDANVDALTGLANKRAFDRALPSAENDPTRAVVRFDLNGFKAVNDTHGHATGDAVLASVPVALHSAAADAGVPARIFRVGGDEFAAIVPADKAEAFRTAAEQHYGVQDHGAGVRSSISGGIGMTDAEADAAAMARKQEHKAAQGIAGRGAPTPTIDDQLARLKERMGRGEEPAAPERLVRAAPDDMERQLADEQRARDFAAQTGKGTGLAAIDAESYLHWMRGDGRAMAQHYLERAKGDPAQARALILKDNRTALSGLNPDLDAIKRAAAARDEAHGRLLSLAGAEREGLSGKVLDGFEAQEAELSGRGSVVRLPGDVVKAGEPIPPPPAASDFARRTAAAARALEGAKPGDTFDLDGTTLTFDGHSWGDSEGRVALGSDDLVTTLRDATERGESPYSASKGPRPVEDIPDDQLLGEMGWARRSGDTTRFEAVKQEIVRRRQAPTSDEPIPAPPTARDAAPVPPGGVRIQRVPVSEIHVDPERFQFKANTDPTTGAGAELKGLSTFDESLAGVLSVWRDPADGKLYAINGHHRLELAQRTGHPSVNVQVIDAPDAASARAAGALANIAEGRGTAIDAATFFRETGLTADAIKDRISLKGAIARQGVALAKLPDDLFRRVAREEMPAATAAAVADELSTPELQRAAFGIIEKSGQRLTEAEVRALARQVAAAGTERVTQDDLFGERTTEIPLIIEKAKLQVAIGKALARDRQLFGYVSKGGRAEELARAGNRIDVEGSQRLAEQAAQLEELFTRLATRSGPIADLLTEGARRIAAGERADVVARQLYPTVETAVRETIAGGAGGGNPAPGAANPDGQSQAGPDAAGRQGAGGHGNAEAEGLGLFGEAPDETRPRDTPDPDQGGMFESRPIDAQHATARQRAGRSAIQEAPAAGVVRLYHGGAAYDGGPRWLTPDRAYAEGYARKNGGVVQFVDVPEDSPLLRKAFDDEGTSTTAPFVNFEAPPDLARQLRPLAEDAPRTLDDLAQHHGIDLPDGPLPDGLSLGEHASFAPVSDEPVQSGQRLAGPSDTPLTPEEQQVAPVLPLITAKGLERQGDALRRIFAPDTRTPESGTTSRIIRAGAGVLRHQNEIARERLMQFAKTFRLMHPSDRLAFIDNIETGSPQPNPELQGAADTMRDLLDTAREEVRALGTGKLETFYVNYFPRIWQEPDAAVAWIKRVLGKRSLEGPKTFLKKRTFATMREGIEAGLKPVTDNPIDLTLLKLREMRRYIMGQRVLEELKPRGLVKFVGAMEQAPDGYIRVDDKLGTVYGPPEVQIKEAFDLKVREGLQGVIDGLGFEHVRKPNIGGQRLGYAQMGGAEKMVTKFGGPNEVIMHELGHLLDDRFGLWDQLTDIPGKSKEAVAARKQVQGELRALADLRFDGMDDQVSAHFKSYVRNKYEKVANAVHALIYAPELMQQHAPTIKARLTEILASRPETAPILAIKPSLVLGTETATAPIHGLVVKGHYYAPEPVATILNNYLSPGLRGNALFDAYSGAANLMNQAQLGLSAYHLGMTSLDAAVSRVALGIEQGVGLHPVDAIRSFASAPAAPVTNLLHGHRLLRAYLAEAPPADLAPIVHALEQAGGTARMDDMYKTGAAGKFMEALAHRHPIATALYALPALFETAAKPVLEWVVPRQKLGVFYGPGSARALPPAA
jgi:diguanylate cyclase (GGDEF)-like protein